MKLVFIDKNEELYNEVEKLFGQFKTNVWGYDLAVENGDITKKKVGLFVTASNPEFQAGGGLDALLAKKFKKEWVNLKEGVQTEHLFPVISVNSDKVAQEWMVKRSLALVFLKLRNEDVVYFTGLGTGIGGLKQETFIKILKDVIYANLSYADLSYANLSYANLSYADLSYANLSYADLSYANLSYANLSYANLSYANLSYANLRSSPFDGLTLRQFVDKYKLKIRNGKLRLFKAVSSDLKSPQQSGSGAIEYKIGEIIEDKYCNFHVQEDCGHGLNLCPTKALASSFGTTFLEVEVDLIDFVCIPSDGHKVRVKRLKVIKLLK